MNNHLSGVSMSMSQAPSLPGRSMLWVDLVVLAVAVIWGASYPVAKVALAHAPVLVLILYRFVITAAIMALVARRDIATASRRDLLAGMVLGGILFGIFLAETRGIARTSATNAALIISLCTVITPFLDYGLRGRLPPLAVICGAALAILGVAFLAGGMTVAGSGDLLILGAAMLRAIMVVSTRRLMAGSALSTAALTAVQASTVMALTLVVLLTLSGPSGLFVTAGPGFWAAVAFLSLFCTIAAFYVQNAALRRSTPTRVSFLMGTEPLFGFALSWALLSEAASASTLLGAGLIVGGTFLGLVFEREG